MPEENNKKQLDKCPTKILDDLPSDKDAFGGHQRVADAIADMIENDEGGKAVALIGTWGSGKSTVIELIKKYFTEKIPDTKVFVFDAWAHKSDTLRRTFLEKFARFLNKGWDPEKKIADSINSLINPKATTHQKINWMVTLGGLLIAICVPLGCVLISISQNTSKNWSYLGIILLLLPLIFNLISFWVLRNQHYFTTERVSETVISPEPTSIDFQTEFFEILKGILSEEKEEEPQRKLVVVLDNLDRIKNKDEARSIWTTMRTFFEFENIDRKKIDWINHFWLFVPFDVSFANELWGSTNENNVELAEEFINKTFQFRFYIPPPILPKWQDYLLTALHKAFCQDDPKSPNLSDEIHDIIDVYYRFALEENPDFDGILFEEKYLPPTPRDIKLFTNNLVMSYRLWHEIPLKYHAFYLIKRERENKALIDIVVGRYYEKYSKHFGNSVYLKYLPTLHFNLAEAEAQYVLMWRRIKEAFENGESGLLEGIKKHEKFHYECEKTLERYSKSWSGMSSRPYFVRTAYVLSKIDGTDKAEWKYVWDILDKSDDNSKKDFKLDTRIAKGFQVLFELSKDKKQFVIHTLQNILSWKPTNETNNKQVRDEWLEGAIILVKTFQREHLDQIKEHLKVDPKASYYQDLKRKLKVQQKRDKMYFLFIREDEELETEIRNLTAKVKRGEYGIEDAERLDSLLSTRTEMPWSNIIKIEDDKASANEPYREFRRSLEGQLMTDINENETHGCLRSLLDLRYKFNQPFAVTALKVLRDGGHIFARLGNSSSNPNIVALCIFSTMEEYRNIESLPTQSMSQSAHDGKKMYMRILDSPQNHSAIVKHFTKIVMQYDKTVENITRLLISNAIRYRDNAPTADLPSCFKFVSQVLKEIIKEENWNKFITDELLEKFTEELKELLEDYYPL